MLRLVTIALLTGIFFLPLGAQTGSALYPGDTNNDGICNYLDLLPVGLLWNFEFIPRDNPDLTWRRQRFVPWPVPLPVSEVNGGFSDTDGNGFIDGPDLLAMELNFDSIQILSEPPPEPWLPKLKDTLRHDPPVEIRIFFDRDTVGPGDSLTAFLEVQIPDDHPTGALGTAIWLTYDPELVREERFSIHPDTIPGDLLFLAAVPQRVLTWRSLPSGNFQFSAAGRGQNALQGQRILVSAGIIIEDKILAREIPFSFDCKEWVVLNRQEQILPSRCSSDSLLILREPNGMGSPNWPDDIRIGPVPVRQELFLQHNDRTIEEMTLFDPYGRKVFRKGALLPGTHRIFFPDLPPGIYHLRLRTGTRLWSGSIVIIP